MTEETPMKLHYFEGSTTCRPIVMAGRPDRVPDGGDPAAAISRGR
jgi:hypothetical protein